MKKNKNILLLLLISCLTIQVTYAQKDRHCGFPMYKSEEVKSYSPRKKLNKVDQLKAKLVKEYRPKSCFFSMPVVIHVLHYPDEIVPAEGTSNPTSEELYSIIDDFNETMEGYNDATGCTLNFCPTLYDEDHQQMPEPGINRIQLEEDQLLTLFGTTGMVFNNFESQIMPELIWDPTKYVNVWMMPNIFYYKLGFPLPSNIAGITYFPSNPNLDGIDLEDPITNDNYLSNMTKDGIVLNTFSAIGTTWVHHELGHWLGNLHTFGYLNSCDNDDYCEDTGLYKASHNNCIDEESCGEPDPIHNYLSTTHTCRDELTPCQYWRVFNSVGYDFMRSSIVQNAHVCSEQVCAAFLNQYYDVLCIGDPFSWLDYIDVFVEQGTPIFFSYSIDGGNSWTSYSDDPSMIATGNLSYTIRVAVQPPGGFLKVIATLEFDMWVILDCDWPPHDDDDYDYEMVDSDPIKNRVYPNPSQNRISVTNSNEIESIQIFDLLYTEQQIISNNFENVDISNFSDGVLLVQIKHKDGSVTTSKIVKTAY